MFEISLRSDAICDTSRVCGMSRFRQ